MFSSGWMYAGFDAANPWANYIINGIRLKYSQKCMPSLYLSQKKLIRAIIRLSS